MICNKILPVPASPAANPHDMPECLRQIQCSNRFGTLFFHVEMEPDAPSAAPTRPSRLLCSCGRSTACVFTACRPVSSRAPEYPRRLRAYSSALDFQIQRTIQPGYLPDSPPARCFWKRSLFVADHMSRHLSQGSSSTER